MGRLVKISTRMPARVIAMMALLKKAELTMTARGQRQAINSSKRSFIASGVLLFVGVYLAPAGSGCQTAT